MLMDIKTMILEFLQVRFMTCAREMNKLPIDEEDLGRQPFPQRASPAAAALADQ